MDDVQHEQRDAAPAEDIRAAEQLEGAEGGGRETALQDDAELLLVARDHLVEAALHDEAPGRGQALLELLGLLQIGGGRVADPAVVERVLRQLVAHADGRPDIVLADHGALHVRGADAQADHRGQVRGLGQAEPLLDHAREVLQARPRVHETEGRLEREGVRPLLDHARPRAVVLANHDEGAADHSRRRQIGQRVRGHVGAHDGLPGDRAPHGVVDGCAEEGSGRGLAGRGVEVDAHRPEEGLVGVGHDVEEMRHRSARIAAHV